MSLSRDPNAIDLHRRSVLRLAAGGIGMAAGSLLGSHAFAAQNSSRPNGSLQQSSVVSTAAAAQHQGTPAQGWLNVRAFGATGDGKTIDSPALNKAIEAAAAQGGGTVLIPAGMYACYSLRLKSFVSLYLDPGATIVAATVPLDGTSSGGYDAAEPQGAWEPYQDYGHNHWHNSLIWGENIHDVSIYGPGLIWGKGLSRGHDEDKGLLPENGKPGVANKAIALKNCYNIILRDFSILQGGWFGILATGVDNLSIDNLKIDTNRDGMDIDCCRNVRVSNCTINSPWDDGICPKSSFALGYARPTENLTITNCMVTGGYELGSVLDGTWKRMPESFSHIATGRIKCGTESNGGFLNITVSNCVFDNSRGFALESVDGARCEDITFTGITMRGITGAPFFIRLGKRMRGPAGVPVGTVKRILLSNITSYGAGMLPSIISGVPGNSVEDIKISNVFLHQLGGGSAALAARMPPENEQGYPDPEMFGELPATGIFCRHVSNLEVSNVEVMTASADARAAFWLSDVQGSDFFRTRVAKGGSPTFSLHDVEDFRSFGSKSLADISIDRASTRQL